MVWPTKLNLEFQAKCDSDSRIVASISSGDLKPSDSLGLLLNIGAMSENSYFNESLDFYIEKPGTWDFIPTIWAVNFRRGIKLAEDDAQRILEQANIPFVYIRKDLARNDLVFPTVQVTCRPFPTPSKEQKANLLSMQVKFMEENFQDFECVETSSSRTISNCPANYLVATYTLSNEENATFACLGHTWSIFDRNLVFTVGGAGDSQNLGDYKDEMEFIIDSVLVGHSL